LDDDKRQPPETAASYFLILTEGLAIVKNLTTPIVVSGIARCAEFGVE
jgi:hypothetical protein